MLINQYEDEYIFKIIICTELERVVWASMIFNKVGNNTFKLNDIILNGDKENNKVYMRMLMHECFTSNKKITAYYHEYFGSKDDPNFLNKFTMLQLIGAEFYDDYFVMPKYHKSPKEIS